MLTFRFFKFPVYLQAKDFYKKILILANRIQNNYPLRDQIIRATLSVILNIAEGSAKKSDKDFARFLEISIASTNEAAACLDIMKDLNVIDEHDYQILLSEAESIVKQLGGFIKKLYQ